MPYFEPSSSERRGVVVLGLALLLIIAVGLVVFLRGEKSETPRGDEGRATGLRTEARRPSTPYYAVPERKVETFPFDPNEADSTTLLRLGLPPFMVRNIYKYRARGGRYHEPRDLRHTYGMTNELWDRLAPYIRIGHKYQYVEPEPRPTPAAPSESASPDTLRRQTKLAQGQSLSLNEADTTALKQVPGIGSYFARQIVRYREQLGGYVSLAQLQEIEGMPEGVEPYLRVDASQVRHIDVNHASKNQLVRHPYLRVYRARSIWDHVHNVGPLRGIDDLRSLPDFTDDDVRRLAPYLEFH